MAAGGDRDLIRRRSLRLVRKKELSACASEKDLILMLKREMKALRDLRKERLAREGLLDLYMAGWHAAATKTSSETHAQPAGKTTKRMKRVVIKKSRVPEKLIEYMILNRCKPFQGICDDLEAGKRPQWFREKYAERAAVANKLLEYEGALIKQFRTKGYADDYSESEVTDNEEEN